MTEPINPYAPPSPANEPPLKIELDSDPRALTLEFTMNIDDMLRWNQYFHRHSPAMRRQFRNAWVLTIVLVSVLLLLVPWLLNPNQAIRAETLLFALALAGAIALTYPILYRQRINRSTRAIYSQAANSFLFGRRCIAISPQFVVYSTARTQTIARWSAVEQIVVDGGDVFIILAQIQAVVVPRHAFASDAQREHFVRAADEFRRQAATSV